MPLLLFLVFPVAEIFLFVRLCQIYSFMDVMLMVITSGFLGLLIMYLQSKSVVMAVQKSFARGEVPGPSVLHSALVFLGGFFLFLPGFISDVIGILLILPGFRHLFVLYLRVILAKNLASGSIKVFSNFAGGFGAAGGFSGANGPLERDAQVVDVEVLETSSKRIE